MQGVEPKNPAIRNGKGISVEGCSLVWLFCASLEWLRKGKNEDTANKMNQWCSQVRPLCVFILKPPCSSVFYPACSLLAVSRCSGPVAGDSGLRRYPPQVTHLTFVKKLSYPSRSGGTNLHWCNIRPCGGNEAVLFVGHPGWIAATPAGGTIAH